MVRLSLRIQQDHGAPGRIFVLVYTRDEERAELLRSRGAQVYFGELDSFFNALLGSLPEDEVLALGIDAMDLPADLQPALISVTTDVRHATTLDANPRKLFNGSAATYSDISNDLTFGRALQASILKTLQEKPIAVILGAGGVGKTTLARQVVTEFGAGVDGV